MLNLRFSTRSIPLLFLILIILAYGLMLPWTGFYWDDWPFAWIAHSLGPAEFMPAFAPFRPFLGPIFFVTTSLLPETPLAWQVFALIIRFLLTLAAWWTFKSIWPRHRLQTLAAALLLLVFPGYSQHWVALTHINQELIPLIFYLLSFGMTARAIRDARRFLPMTLSALLLLAAGLFPTEYFIGLEPLRFLFIWVVLSEQTSGLRSRLGKDLHLWLPYLLIWIANGLWLYYYYNYGAYASYDVEAAETLQNASLSSLTGLALAMLDAFLKAGFYIWAQVLVLAAQTIAAPSTLATLALVAAAFWLLSYYLSRLDLADERRRAFALPALLIGALGILLGRLPSWAAGLPLTLQSSYDRFMVSMMIGGSLFAAGLIELAFAKSRYRLYAFSLILALGVGQQFFNANIFRRDWLRQQEIYWQFAWRVPAMQPGTLLLTHQMPLDYETDLSMTAPLNWIYAPDLEPPNLPYALLYTEKRLGGSALPTLEPGTPVTINYRTVTFRGSTSQAVVIFVPPNGCLRVLDPLYADAETYKKASPYLTQAIPLSAASWILTDAPSPALPSPPFNREPEHGWCYYYEKAELARQMGNWEEIVMLGEEALAQGYRPQDAFEWLPFIEAYAYSGDLAKAEQITRDALTPESSLRTGLCLLWERVSVAKPEAGETALALMEELQCTP